MKCLQCGKELALLKKFTDGEFCSPEHRTVFNDRMQRLSIERLSESARRVGLKTRFAASAAGTHAPTQTKAPHKSRKEDKLPPYAAFLPAEEPVLCDCCLAPVYAVEFDNSDLLIIPPVFAYRPGSHALLAGLTHQFLHARPATLRFQAIRVDFAPISAKTVCLDHVLSKISNRVHAAQRIVTYSAPVDSCRRATADQPDFSPFSSSPTQPALTRENGLSSLSSRSKMKRLEGPDSRLGDVSLQGAPSPTANARDAVAPELFNPSQHVELRTHGSPFRVGLSGPVADAALSGFEQIPSVPQQGKLDPGIGTFTAAETNLAPYGVEKPFRMRPRGGVDDQSVAAFGRVEPGTLQSQPDIAIVNAALVRTHTSGPIPARRPVRARVTAGVNDPTSICLQGIDTGGLADLASPPAVPGVANALGDLAPNFVSRPFRMRPRAGVESPGLQSFTTSGMAPYAPAQPIIRIAELPDPSAWASTPVFLERTFRMRPRGPVASNCTTGDSVRSAVPLQCAATPDLGGLSTAHALECAPAQVDRTFRMRPRGPVGSTSLPEYVPIDASGTEPFVSPAAIVGYPRAELIERTPVALDRIVRLRPRGPVASDGMADVARTGATETEPLRSSPQRGCLPSNILIECAPAIVDRPFRMRPRGPANDSEVAVSQSIAAGAAEPLLSTAHCGRLPADILAPCAPNAVEKPFRMRPRGPLADEHVSLSEPIGTGEIASLASTPVSNRLPAEILVECAPSLIAKPYRMRPRGGIDREEGRVASIPAHSGMPVPGTPAVPTDSYVVLPDCSPRALDRVFRMRPKGGVADPAIVQHHATRCDALEPSHSPVPKTRFEPTVAVELVPAFRSQFFRMRPRGPVNDGAVPVLSGITAAAETTNASSPAMLSLPISGGSDYEPGMGGRPIVTVPAKGVLALAMSRFQSLPSSELIAKKTPAGVDLPIARMHARLEPAFIDKLYRMRPRGPAASGPVLLALDPGAIELVLPLPVMPEMPAVLMRQASMTFREKPIKMRPRGPKPGTTATSQSIEPLAAEPDAEAAASCIAIDPDAVRAIGINGATALQLDIEPVERWMPVMIAAPGRPRLVTPIDAEFEIYAQTLSDVLAPAAYLQPATAETFVEDPSLVLQPIALPIPVSSIVSVLEVIAPENTSISELPRIADGEKPSESGHIGWLESIAAFWNGLAMDQKLAGAIGVLMVIVFVHSLTTGLPRNVARRVKQDMQTADIASNPIPPLKDAASSGWRELKPVLQSRASLDLQEDFSDGLNAWDGGPEGLKGWTKRPVGVTAGAFAVYKPSIGLSDYELQFSGEIERRGLGFVFRALNRKNYYAVKLDTIKSHGMRTIYLVRYAVINGKVGPKTKVPVAITVSNDTILRVGLNAKEQFFTLVVDGKVVDFWSDNRLSTGGIGFFTNSGEQARLHTVRVAHQDDTLGKLCAFLSLQDTQR